MAFSLLLRENIRSTVIMEQDRAKVIQPPAGIDEQAATVMERWYHALKQRRAAGLPEHSPIWR